MIGLLLVTAIALASISCVHARGSSHWYDWEDAYTPDYVLVATAQNYSMACESRYSVLFNGTSPGPALSLKENATTWIRVYNDIPSENLTVVR